MASILLNHIGSAAANHFLQVCCSYFIQPFFLFFGLSLTSFLCLSIQSPSCPIFRYIFSFCFSFYSSSPPRFYVRIFFTFVHSCSFCGIFLLFRYALFLGMTATEAAEELCDLALKLGSSDNVTAVIVQFIH